jgi:hypothetical protein
MGEHQRIPATPTGSSDTGQRNVDGGTIVADGTPLDDVWDGDNPPASVPPPNLPLWLCRSEFHLGNATLGGCEVESHEVQG